ncbi:hypothetical protein JCM10450v2_004605 [Rhodotorula kratochvilovae]
MSDVDEGEPIIYTFYDVVHLLAPYPPGHEHALPDLPWYLLPSAYCPVPATWERRDTDSTRRYRAVHNAALDKARAVWAETPRDEAAVKRALNRKKHERKMRSKARRKAQASLGDGDGDEQGGEGGEGDFDDEEDEFGKAVVRDQYEGLTQVTDVDKLREATTLAEDLRAILAARLSFVHEGSRFVWGFPPALKTSTVARLRSEYMESYKSFEAMRSRFSELPFVPDKKHEWGDAFFFPDERPRPGQQTRMGVFRDPKTRKMLMLLELNETGELDGL